MNSTNYPGINYSRGQSNTDTDTSVRYGVICQNSVSGEAVEDVYHGPHSRDMAFESHRDEIKEAIASAIKGSNKLEDSFRERDLESIIEAAFDEAEEHIASLLAATDPLYEHDGYKITKCLDCDLMILKSPFYTYAQYCSPCVPGAGNLNHPFDGPIENWCKAAEEAGFPKVFCLGHDWFDDNTAPYPVFSVATNEQVQP